MLSTRRHFLMSTAAPLLAQKQRSPERPSIVLILADGLSAWMLSCYGNKEIRTPNIDLLARSGMRFINHYACTPAPAVSRATLFTGRTPGQLGVKDVSTDSPPPALQKEIMISDLLSSNGYKCAYAGKWGMGADETPQHGFQSWYSTLDDSYHNPKISRDGTITQEQGYLAELVTRKSVEYLEQQKPGQPFFLVASYLNPHPPYEWHPQKYYDMYAKTAFDTVGWETPSPDAVRRNEYLKDIVGNLRKAAAGVTALDDQVGTLLTTLRNRGLRDNALVVFTSENGYCWGRHGLWDSGLGSDRINLYDPVMKTPLIWSWWGKIPVEAERPELVSLYDFLPSVCDALRIEPPAGRNLCGRSYTLLAMNKPLPKKNPWEEIVFGQCGNTEMARDFRFKLILRDKGEGQSELYDVRNDPREKVNQYDNPQFVSPRNDLTKELDEWRQKYS